MHTLATIRGAIKIPASSSRALYAPDMRKRALPVLAFSALIAALIAPAPVRADDIYRCMHGGQEVYVNGKAIDRKVHKRCRLVLKGSKAPAPSTASGEAEPDSGKPATGSTKTKRRRRSPLATPSPRRLRSIRAIVAEAARRHHLPEAFLYGVIHTESRFKVRALSPAGAMGLTQLMPGTAAAMGVSDPYDAYENVMGGARYLRQLADRFDGDFVRVISGYHAGGAAVARKGGIPYERTDEYVRRVLDAYYAFADGEMEPPD